MKQKYIYFLSVLAFVILHHLNFLGINFAVTHTQIIPVNSYNNPDKIELDSGTLTFKLYKSDKLILSCTAISGAPKTPTPEGTWTILPNNIHNDKTVFSTTWGNYVICAKSNYQGKTPILAKFSKDTNYTDGTILLNNDDYQKFISLCKNKYFELTIINTKPIFRELSIGSYGYDVLLIQTALKKQGYSINNTDGYYTQNTQKSVREFQKNNALYPTGKININTYLKIIRF